MIMTRSLRAQQTTEYPRAETIYVLGTSEDLRRLDKKFFDDNITIGVNQSYLRAEQVGSELTYWVTLDESFKFFFWMHGDTSPHTYKFIWKRYCLDHRFKKLKKVCREDCIRIYDHRPLGQVFKATLDQPIILDQRKYTIITAISIATALRPKEIRLRGVALTGKYIDATIQTKWDNYYEEIGNYLKGFVWPALKRMGIKFVNETVNSQIKFE